MATVGARGISSFTTTAFVVQPLDALTGPADPPAYAPLNTGPDYVAVLRSLLAG
ncbi:hypothetical protein [Streptomyces tsukubensis]|uniref:hypothetical protein n=1 Tax=Streptomyces tsukubensis TaxID=83656 RepID=UPI0015C31AD1|nr:hypothetical protein [Streptomyces tsukubensis]